MARPCRCTGQRCRPWASGDRGLPALLDTTGWPVSLVSTTGTPWVCPLCTRSLANRDRTHACRPPRDVDEPVVGTDPQVGQVRRRLRGGAPVWAVTVLPQSSRIALQVRMTFAAFVARRHRLDGHVALSRPLGHPRFVRVEEHRGQRSPGLHLSGRENVDVRSWPRLIVSAARTTCPRLIPLSAGSVRCGRSGVAAGGMLHAGGVSAGAVRWARGPGHRRAPASPATAGGRRRGPAARQGASTARRRGSPAAGR